MFNEEFDPLEDLQQTMILLSKHSEVIADIISAHNKMARDLERLRRHSDNQSARISQLESRIRHL